MIGDKDPSRQSQALTEQDLHNWKLLEAFQDAVERVFSKAKLAPTLGQPSRKLNYGPYLSAFLFGLINPVIESMRGLCEITALPRVQEEVCGAKISLGSFSEMQHVVDPQLLREVFRELVGRTALQQKPDARLAHLNLIAQDGSLWRALPRMVWAEYGVGPKGEAKGVRLHLRFHLIEGKPQDAQVQRGKSCERQALRQMGVPGQVNVADRYYGEDYRLFGDVDQAGGYFVFRLKESAVVNPQQELPLTAEDRTAGVVRHLWATLGATEATRSIRVRMVEIRVRDQHLLLVSNLPLEQASAALIGLIYRKRWDIELFFRWIKCILGCRHFFAESPEGVAIQLYLALIASLLFQYYSGRRPNKRMMELIQFYLMGWATAEDLIALMEKQTKTKTPGKKA